jgi:hypothetical protein
MNPPNFRAAYCARHHCAESAFERRIFWRGLYRHAVPLALLLRLFSPAFFRPDAELITRLAGAGSLAEVNEDIDSYEYGNRVRSNWLRTGFLIRLNSARIRAMARQCIPGA